MYFRFGRTICPLPLCDDVSKVGVAESDNTLNMLNILSLSGHEA